MGSKCRSLFVIGITALAVMMGGKASANFQCKDALIQTQKTSVVEQIKNKFSLFKMFGFSFGAKKTETRYKTIPMISDYEKPDASERVIYTKSGLDRYEIGLNQETQMWSYV